jgi:putative glycosyltransferase (TIGR04372 family)
LPAQKGDHNSDDLILYRPVFRAGTEERLTYREMLQQRIPGFGSQRNFEESGLMVGENAPEELLSAVKEHLARRSGDYIEDATLQARYQQLGAEYEADTQPQHGAYSVAHEGWGRLCQSTLPSNWLD